MNRHGSFLSPSVLLILLSVTGCCSDVDARETETKASAAVRDDEIILLKPYPSAEPLEFFEKIDRKDTRPWRYGSVENIEVLSRCVDRVSERFVRDLQRRMEALRAVALRPPVGSMDEALRLLLYEDSNDWAVKQNPRAIPVLSGHRAEVTIVVNLANYTTTHDAVARDEMMLDATAEVARRFVIEQIFRFASKHRDGNHDWMRFGLHHFYLDMHFTPDGATVTWPPFLSDPKLKSAFEVVGSRPDLKSLPMPELFDVPYRDQAGLWSLKLGLFLRWCLLDPATTRRDAYWDFCRHCLQEPMTEDLFKTCFGVDYEHAELELADRFEHTHGPTPLPRRRIHWFNAPPGIVLESPGKADIERFRISVDYAVDHMPRL